MKHFGVLTAAIIILTMAASLIVTAGLVWLVCWAFNLLWSWKIAIGVWALIFLLSAIFKSTVHKE